MWRGSAPDPGIFKGMDRGLGMTGVGIQRGRGHVGAVHPRAMPPALVLADVIRRLCFDYPSSRLRPRIARFLFRQKCGVSAICRVVSGWFGRGVVGVRRGCCAASGAA